MTAALTLLVAATGTATTPASGPGRQLEPYEVTPGLLGFLVVFALALVVYLLFRNLTSRLRRMRFREEERLAAEAGAEPDDGSTSTPRTPGPRTGPRAPGQPPKRPDAPTR
ncbi:MAG TPA: hypothetical protein VF661_00815 [Actinomycetales bacterium]